MKHNLRSFSLKIFCPASLRSPYFSPLCAVSEGRPSCSLFPGIYPLEKTPRAPSRSILPTVPPSGSRVHTRILHPLPSFMFIPGGCSELGAHICAASHTPAWLTAQKVAVQGVGGEKVRGKISGKVMGLTRAMLPKSRYCRPSFFLFFLFFFLCDPHRLKAIKQSINTTPSPSTSYIKTGTDWCRGCVGNRITLMQSCKILLIHSRQVIFWWTSEINRFFIISVLLKGWQINLPAAVLPPIVVLVLWMPEICNSYLNIFVHIHIEPPFCITMKVQVFVSAILV